MGNSQHRAFLELLGYHLLNESVVFDVDVGGRFVDEHHLAVLEEGTANAQKLLFAGRQTIVGDGCVEPSFFFDDFPQVALAQNGLKFLVVVALSDIEILSEGGLDESWVLVDHGD
jgi:hypothetical protein